MKRALILLILIFPLVVAAQSPQEIDVQGKLQTMRGVCNELSGGPTEGKYSECFYREVGACVRQKCPIEKNCGDTDQCRAPVATTCAKIYDERIEECRNQAPVHISVGMTEGEDVEVIHADGKTEHLKPGMALAESDRVRTGLGSKFQLKLPNATVSVDELTEFKVGLFRLGKVNDVELWLKAGGVQVEEHRAAGVRGEFRVKTPTATASVRGTNFFVAYNEKTNETHVAVIEGQVEVAPENKDLKPLTLSPNQETRVTKDLIAPVSVTSRGGGTSTIVLLGAVILLAVLGGWVKMRRK